VCGDGVVEGLEECDDGNTASGDGCSAHCTLESSTELCADGMDNDLDGQVDCADSDCLGDPACSSATCGNGVVEAGEQCDDGNATDGDGCSTTCLLEEHAISCTDGIDNDRDGLIDCADPNCASDPGCP
jgi:cysteine-rich repeat protein